jgi:hypothetical protein
VGSCLVHRVRPRLKLVCIRLRQRESRSQSKNMYIPGSNKLDSELLLTPRQYLANPMAFGSTTVKVRPVLPTNGNVQSQKVALHLHRLSATYNARESVKGKFSLKKFLGDHKFSKSTWSRILLGYSWPGARGLTALDEAIRIRTARD